VADRVDRLTDSLTVRLFQELGQTRPISSVRRAGFGSTSLAAIKAFLQGEQFLRRSEWDSALGYYERALELDSTFPLALRRTSTALGWLRTGYDSLSDAYALRAGAFNHGLAPRDSLLVLSDSLFAAMFEAGPLGASADSGWGNRLQRFFATVEGATARYPDDPETWNNLGEALDHFGAYMGRSYEDQLQAFDQAIELDSAYAPAYLHPIDVSVKYGPEAARKYLKPYLALNPKDEAMRLVERLLDSVPGGAASLPAILSHVSGHSLFGAFNSFNRMPDTLETAIAIGRVLASHRWSTPPLNQPGFGARLLTLGLMTRGHLRAGGEAMPETENLPIFADGAIMGAIPAERAANRFRKELSNPAATMGPAFPWWASHEDTVSLRTAVSHADSIGHADPARRALQGYLAASAKAYLALVRGDSTGAIQQLLALPHGVCPSCYQDQLTVARLLVDRGRDREAWSILRGEHASATLAPFPTAVLWELLRARVAERIGERDVALRSYSWVTGMWRNADPELQPYVTEAREGLARLTAEPK
jgi:serine/threonine-protein kinase